MQDGLPKVKRFSLHAKMYASAQSQLSNTGVNYLNVVTSMYHEVQFIEYS